MKINTSDIKELSSSAIRCDGTINIALWMNDGSVIDIYGLTIRQADSLELLCQNKNASFNVDPRLLTQTEEQWLRQNGIKVGGAQ